MRQRVKRVFAGLMLILFLLNMLGFYGVYMGWQLRNAQLTSDRLDRDQYSSDDAVTFKIPFAIPYAVDQDEYERASGEFVHEGQVYQMLKQRLHNDTLYIVCVKDLAGQEIHQAMTDYVKTFTDKPANAKQETSKSLSANFIKDYLTTGIVIQSQSAGWGKLVTYADPSLLVPSSHTLGVKHPPRNHFS